MRTSDSDPQGKSARLYFMDENPSRDGQRCITLMKISSRRHLQFFQADFETELLQAVDAAFCYSLTVAFIKVVST